MIGAITSAQMRQWGIINSQGVSMIRSCIAWLFCLSLLTGCGHAPAGAEHAARSRPRFAVIPKATSHEFWQSVHAGAIRGAEKAGVDIDWKGPITESDREGQINVVQDFIAQKIDGICLAPLDSQALIAAVRSAKAEGIPTVIFDSALADESDIVSYVATDNYRCGELAARAMGPLVGRHGRVILLRYNPGSESTEQREQGFLDAIAKGFPNIKVISSDKYLGTTPHDALSNSQQLLSTIGDKLDGVFTVCEPNNEGMLKALESARLAGKIKFIGFDPNEHMIQAMRDGKVDGIVLQDPVQMGYLAVKVMLDHLEGRQVEKRIPTGEYLATPQNLDEKRMHELLNPVQF
jgi:ribose transport system substrate-binding protein